MKIMFRLFIVILVAGSCSCDSKKALDSGTPLAPTPNSQTSAPSDQYKVVVDLTGTTLEEGSDVTIPVSIRPGSGFKINQEYPWKIEIESGSEVLEVKPASLNRDTILLSDKAAKFEIAGALKSKGKHVVHAVASFSVCNDDVCKNFRDEELAIEFASAEEAK